MRTPDDDQPADPRRRRVVIAGAAATAFAALPALPLAAAGNLSPTIPHEERRMATFTTKDGTTIWYKDWGKGPVVSFSHGWPLSADAWDPQIFHLASNGFRCIAHDRRGHGRSSQPWNGNEMDAYADDLEQLFEHWASRMS